MLALSIRQPYAELISPRRVACEDLRGVKTIEYRSMPTRIIGERFYNLCEQGIRGQGSGVFAIDALPSALESANLPRGVIVGTAKIERCIQNNGHYEWHLTDVRRLRGRGRKPKGRPQPLPLLNAA